eukprot:3993989-Pyramimonas_sp.AAC.1
MSIELLPSVAGVLPGCYRGVVGQSRGVLSGCYRGVFLGGRSRCYRGVIGRSGGYSCPHLSYPRHVCCSALLQRSALGR